MELSDEIKSIFNSSNYLISVYEVHPNGGFSKPDFKISFFNSKLKSLLQLEESDFSGKSLTDIFPEMLMNGLYDVICEVERTDKTSQVQKKMLFEGFGEMFLDVQISKFNNFIINTSKNITAVKRTELEMKEKEEMLDEAHRLLEMGTWTLDLTSKKITSSVDLVKLFGIQKNTRELNVEEYYSLMTDNDAQEAQHNFGEIVKSGKSFSIERRMLTANGEEKFFEITGKPVYDFEKCVKLMGTFRDITKRKKLEVYLFETKLLKMGSWEFDFSYNRFHYSKELSEILEYDEPFDFNSFEEYFAHVHHDEKVNSKNNFRKILNDEMKVDVERKMITNKGNVRYIEFVSKSFVENGVLKKVFGTFRDITEKKLQELVLLENEKRLIEAQALLKTGTWEVDTQSQILTISKEAENILQNKLPKSAPVLDYFKFIHPDDKERLFQQFIGNIDSGKSFKFLCRLVLEDDLLKYYEVIGQSLAGSHHYKGTIRDISDEYEKDLALKQSEERFRMLFENTPSMYFILDEKGFVTSVNQYGIDYLGYKSPEIMNQHNSVLLHVDDAYKVSKNLELLKLSPENFLQWEARKMKKSGEIIWVKETARLAKNNEGEDIFLIVCEDITSEVINRTLVRKKHEELIHAKEKAESAATEKQQFASIMSHEIRTPLNAVIGMTNLLLMENPRPDQVEELNTLKFAAENLTLLVNDILDFSKIEAGKVALEKIPFDLRHLTHNLKNSYQYKADEKGIGIHTIIDEEVPADLLGDPVRIGQILNNLVSNAIKFTEKGSVEISLRKLEFEKDNHIKIRFEIADTGIGIPKDKQALVFESFSQANSDTTRKYGGTGLGLTITKKLIELHKSEILLSSEYGKGTVFYFDLVFEKASIQKKESAQDVNFVERNIEGKRILLVEDNPFNQLIATKFLQKWKLEVDSAENGKIALKKLDTNSYDLILMDIQMPEMNGIETTKFIRSHENTLLQKIPIIALTAAAMENDKEKLLLDGMNDYVSKPFNPNDLYKKIAQYVQ